MKAHQLLGEGNLFGEASIDRGKNLIAKGDINQFQVPVPKLEDQKLLVLAMSAVFEQCATFRSRFVWSR